MATSAPGSASCAGVESRTTSAMDESRSIGPGARTTCVQTRGLTLWHSHGPAAPAAPNGRLPAPSIELPRRRRHRFCRRHAGLVGRSRVAIPDGRKCSACSGIHVPAVAGDREELESLLDPLDRFLSHRRSACRRPSRHSGTLKSTSIIATSCVVPGPTSVMSRPIESAPSFGPMKQPVTPSTANDLLRQPDGADRLDHHDDRRFSSAQSRYSPAR